MKTTELLLPVGNLSMALAAIHGGGDAIYVGVPGFNARGRSYDFSITELKELIDLCHLYGVKVHLAFNVLIFENELEAALEVLKAVIPLGPDAFIVQDIGLIRMIRQLAPDMRIHGSTQMTITNDESIRLLDDLNIQRFVLGRENSMNEMALIRKGTSRELEVFVHGALCVAYSGQCFTSESLGGRSANRGQCAQSCRLGYELFVDGEKRELGDKKYLVSPQDLCGIEEVPELIKLGIDSFKVEGRLKGPEYVASTGMAYQSKIAGESLTDEQLRNLSLSYSRGFFSGWLHGVDHQRLVEGSYSAHRGLEIGAVVRVNKQSVIIATNSDIRAGFGLLFVRHEREVGAKVFQVKTLKNDQVEVTLLAPFKYEDLRADMRVWINSDDKLKTATEKLVSDRAQMKRIPLKLKLTLKVGDAAVLIASDPAGRMVTVRGPVGEKAQRSLSEDFIWDELGALGTTPFVLSEKELKGSDVHIAQRDLKTMRREMVRLMTEARVVRSPLTLRPVNLAPQVEQKTVKPLLNLVLREKAQVDELVSFASDLERDALGVVFLDYEFGKDYAPSVELLKSKGFKTGIATTRIMKPSEYYNLNIILRAGPDAILVRNLGALSYLQNKGVDLFGDFSLNVTNHLTVEYLLSKGLKSVCASYDLNQVQLQELIAASPVEQMEITLHQYMPEFHMEHCVFAAFMSKGSSFRDCGKPCEKHKVEMKDAYGNMHYLKADQECRNTLFRGSAQSAAFLFDEWKVKPRYWRCEALYERGDVLKSKIINYLSLISGKSKLSDVTKAVGSQEKYGVTPGQLSVTSAWRDRKKES